MRPLNLTGCVTTLGHCCNKNRILAPAPKGILAPAAMEMLAPAPILLCDFWQVKLVSELWFLLLKTKNRSYLEVLYIR